MSYYNTPSDFLALIQGLQNRLSRLEATKVTHGSGAPPTGATEPYVDDANSKLYFKVAGAWKSVTLT